MGVRLRPRNRAPKCRSEQLWIGKISDGFAVFFVDRGGVSQLMSSGSRETLERKLEILRAELVNTDDALPPKLAAARARSNT